MSLEEPIIVAVTTVEEVSLVVDVVTPPIVPAVDVTVIDPGAIVIVDIAGETSFVIDVVTPPPLFAIDVTVGDPAATIVVDIPGDHEDVDEVIGGTITIGSTAPSSPNVNDISDRYDMSDYENA